MLRELANFLSVLFFYILGPTAIAILCLLVWILRLQYRILHHDPFDYLDKHPPTQKEVKPQQKT